MNDDQELMDVFFKEAHDLIDEMRRELTSLNKETNTANLANLFRCAHTLKGSSGIVGFNDLHELALALERIFKGAKDEKCEINPELISLLSKGIEVCQTLLDEREAEGIGELLEQLNRIANSK
jgi:two-component system chemotaxis sensor kinase CheA